MTKRYIMTDFITEIDGVTLHRIRSLENFYVKSSGKFVRYGELGGFIEHEGNLKQDVYDSSWIAEDVKVYGNAKVYDGAFVKGNLRIHGTAIIKGNVIVTGFRKEISESRIEGSYDVGPMVYEFDSSLPSWLQEVKW